MTDDADSGPLEEELAFVLAFAAEAIDLVRELREDRQFAIETKTDGSLVTSVDRHVNSTFIESVIDRFPADQVLGEEECRPAPGPRTWVIDPIDGTEQFTLGVPTYMIAIALTDGVGRPIVACAANPSTRELYHAVRGRGAFRDGVRLRVSGRDGVTEPAIVRTSGAARQTARGLAVDGVVRLSLPGQGGPGPGDSAGGGLDESAGDAAVAVVPVRYPWPSVFSGCKVAEGAWDADLFDHSGAHDVAATALLVTEAGGRATDRHGAEQRYDQPVNGCILSNGVIHDALVEHWRPRPDTD